MVSTLMLTGLVGATTLPAADSTPAAPQRPDRGATGADNRGRTDRFDRGRPDRGNQDRGNQDRGGFMDRRGGFGGAMLDDQQRDLLRESVQKHSDELRKLDEEIRVAYLAFMKVVLAEKQDEAALQEKADAWGKLMAKQKVLQAKAFAPLTPTLKPEQREQYENNPWAFDMIMRWTTGFRGGPGGPGGFGGRGGFGGGGPGGPPGGFGPQR